MRLASNRFAFLVSVLKAREAKGVTPEMLEDILIRASSTAEAVEFLKGTDLGEYLAEIGAVKFQDIDESLWKYLGIYFGRIKKLRPDPSVVRLIDSYLEKYDTANIISALKSVATQRPPQMTLTRPWLASLPQSRRRLRPEAGPLLLPVLWRVKPLAQPPLTP